MSALSGVLDIKSGKVLCKRISQGLFHFKVIFLYSYPYQPQREVDMRAPERSDTTLSCQRKNRTDLSKTAQSLPRKHDFTSSHSKASACSPVTISNSYPWTKRCPGLPIPSATSPRPTDRGQMCPWDFLIILILFMGNLSSNVAAAEVPSARKAQASVKVTAEAGNPLRSGQTKL